MSLKDALKKSGDKVKYERKLLWLDIETTGLEPSKGEILEIGFIVTDLELNEIDSIERLRKGRPLNKIKEMCDDYVLGMHSRNGLFNDLEALKEPTSSSELIDFVGKHFPSNAKKPELHGSTVHFDKKWVDYHIPELGRLFDYRVVDVSTLKIMLQNYAKVHAKSMEEIRKSEHPDIAHRALDDIRCSIVEYKQYLKFLGLLGGI